MSEPARLSLAEVTERFAWSDDQLALGNPVEWLWEYPLEVPPEKLWPHLIDTSRFNRALGLSKMHFSEIDGELHGWSINGGRRQEWIEVPWSWVSNRHLVAERRYSKGWAHVAKVVYHLVPEDGGVCLQVFFGFIPRGMWGRVGLALGVPSLEKGYRKVLDGIVADISAPRPAPYQAPPPELESEARRRLEQLRESLAGEVDPPILDKLVEHIEQGDPLDVVRIQPRRLAHEWELDEQSMLSACLHCTRAGLLQLSWDVICPHCRGVREETARLFELASDSSCDVCQVDFSTDFENAVEVTFHVHESIRQVPKVYYCSAEPSTKLHIKVQQRVEPGAARTVGVSLPPGRYRLRLRGDRIAGYLTVSSAGDADVETFQWRSSGEVGEHAVSSGELEITMANDCDVVELFVIEEVRWSDEALRPSRLFSFQEFRDLFSEEYLGADVQLSIGEQAILFTDMVGSTRFYRRLGDPAAFVKVKEHFGEVFGLVSKYRGAVVKTIGDAVMAAYSDPLDAVRSAIEMHRLFPPRPDEPDPIRLRISINAGPCIAVNLNTGIDYFGGAVNIAAKLQACAEGGEVAISRRVLESPGVAEHLASLGLAYTEGVYEHPALDPIDYAQFSADLEASESARKDAPKKAEKDAG